MKKTAKYLVLCTLALCTFSCRPLGDDLVSYGQNDGLAFSRAEKSYAEEFKVFWTAMNENYGIWDYEESLGMDWDEVYRTYLPRFEALDTMQGSISNAEFQALYQEFCDSLHDGHLLLQIKNISTKQYIAIRPNTNRIMRERGEIYELEQKTLPDLDAYLAGNVAPAYKINAYDRTSAPDICFDICDSAIVQILRASTAYIEMVDLLGGPDTTNIDFYNAVDELKDIAQNAVNLIASYGYISKSALASLVITIYNKILKDYGSIARVLGVKMVEIEDGLKSDQLKFVEYALFEGNIAYLHLGAFCLTPYMEPKYQNKDSASMLFAYQEAVQRVWYNWFDTIQTLHKEGTLGGVIIDVRNNGGGYLNDYKFVLGALLPSGGYESHFQRMKDGSGRHDFGPLMPFVFPTYPDKHEVISDKPIIVLANTNSVSMAEMTTWGVKRQPNGCVVGVRTFGGLSALNTDPKFYSDNYSGAFGVSQQTPIYGYVPKYIGLFPQDGGSLRILESVGIEPDENLPIDADLWSTQRRDNQLEKAIDKINQ